MRLIIRKETLSIYIERTSHFTPILFKQSILSSHLQPWLFGLNQPTSHFRIAALCLMQAVSSATYSLSLALLCCAYMHFCNVHFRRAKHEHLLLKQFSTAPLEGAGSVAIHLRIDWLRWLNSDKPDAGNSALSASWKKKALRPHPQISQVAATHCQKVTTGDFFGRKQITGFTWENESLRGLWCLKYKRLEICWATGLWTARI